MSHASMLCRIAVLSLALGLARDVFAPQGDASGRTFTSDELRPFLLAVMDSYPMDGSHAYWWPRGKDAPKGWVGNSRDLEYGGELLYRGDSAKRGYCCGLTFEVFFEAWRLAAASTGREFRFPGLDRDGVHGLRRAWFGKSIGDSCMRDALVDRGLGYELKDRHEARTGDFVQLWRTNGSGHSVVFLRWIWGMRGEKPRPRIVGIEYWSTQKSTRGIGVRREFFVEDDDPRGRKVPSKARREKLSERRVCPDSTFVVRAGVRPKAR